MSNLKAAKLMNDLKNGLISHDELLYPGIELGNIDVESLKIDIIPSGFPCLDQYMLLKDMRSELIIVGGRPSMGKSAFMFQLAAQVAKTMPVHVFSLEMDKEQIATRLISSRINKPITAIQRGLITPSDIKQAKEELKKLKYIVDDRGGLNIHQLMDAARLRHQKDGTKLIIVDYLQMLKTEKGHSKDDEIGFITRSLKELAKELKIPIIVGSQLNRQNESRGAMNGNYRPLLSDLRESGNIEQDADMVVFVHRESRYTGERQGEADLIVAKNRNGPIGDVTLGFVDVQTYFFDKGDI